MRIALLTDTYEPQVNGVTTVVRRIVAALERAGEEVAVVAPRYPHRAEAPPRLQLRLPSWPFPPYPAIRLSFTHHHRAAQFLDELRPDVIHAVTEGPIGLFGRSYARRNGIPLITSFHTDFPQYTRHYHVPALESLVWRGIVWFHRPAVLVHTPGEHVRDTLRRRGLSHAVVWGRGVDVRRFHPGRHDPDWHVRHGLDDDATIVVHVGRLAPEKNLDVLVQAWRRAREVLGRRVAFLIAGEGPLEDSIARRLPWVRRLGFVDRDALATLYASADICVLPSATETCGLVALEAMASGLPVVAADAGGFRESISDGVTGRLVSPGDYAAFAGAIVELAEQPAQRRALGISARRFAETRDSADEDIYLLGHYRQAAERVPIQTEVEPCPAV